jgi:hypothetical protein
MERAATGVAAGGSAAAGGKPQGENIRAEIERLGREWGTWYVFVYWGWSEEPWRAARIDDLAAGAITAKTSADLEKAVRADHEARTAA